MGIQGLTTHLQPYSHPINLGCTNRQCPSNVGGLSTVIDGPSLVHHIYYALVDNSRGFAGQPTYPEITEGVIIFLDLLQQAGVQV